MIEQWPVARALGLSGALMACAPAGDATRDIAALLQRAATDWNRGDLTGFMSDYARDSVTSFVSGGQVVYGWQTLHDRYESAFFAPGKSRDSLAFDALHVRRLAPAVALATARFGLWRDDSLIASGPFTLVLEQRDGRWLILHDHTSADPRP